MTISEREVVQKALDVRVMLLESLGEFEEAERVRQLVPLASLPGPEDESRNDEAPSAEDQ